MGNRSRLAVSLFATVLVVSLVLAARASISSAQRSRLTGASDRLPYMFDSSHDRLLPLDPSTLHNAAGMPALHLLPWQAGTTYSPELVVSPNGRWIASIVLSSRSNAWNIGIFDARTGKELGMTYQVAFPIAISGLSNNAKHLYGSRQEGNSSTVLSLSAKTGRIQARVHVRNGCCGPALLDAAHHRFYVLMTADTDHPTIGRRAPVLVVYDLGRGKMVGRTVLRGVLAGAWPSKLKEHGVPVPTIWYPGVALSPDGSQIAVFDGSNNQLTLIDSKRLRVERRLTVSDPSTPLNSILGTLGLIPTIAEAKEFQGINLNLQYSADGTMLYLSGFRGVPSHPHAPFQGLGLRAINVAGGHIQASVFPGKQLMGETSASQNNDVYALLPGPGNGCPCTLLRLNGTTLATEARRTGMDPVSLYFLQPAA